MIIVLFLSCTMKDDIMVKNQASEQISANSLHQWQAEHRDFILMDVLPKDRHAAKHIPGSAQACVFEVSFLDQIKKIVDTTEQTIVVYGADDQTMDAPVAADKLLRAGYKHVYILAGGLAGWAAAGFPVEGESPGAEPQTASLHLEEGTWPADPSSCEIAWAGRNPNSTHHGTVALSGGSITVKDGAVGGAFEINMTSIANVNLAGGPLQKVLEDHLKSDDFFFTDRFPKATFTIQTAVPITDSVPSLPNYEIDGEFELLGVRRPLTFAATVNPHADGGYAVEAHFDIDRTQWGVIYGSTRFFKHLGMHMVFDLISMQLRIIVR